jgi:hypothetical protein
MRHALDWRCDKHLVQKAQNHAKLPGGPGAPVVMQLRQLERLPLQTREHLIGFLAEHTNVSDASTKRPTTVTRTHPIEALWRLYKADAEAKVIEKPVGHTYFCSNQAAGAGSPNCERECACDTCHSHGHQAFRALLVLYECVDASFSEVRQAAPNPPAHKRPLSATRLR